MNNAKDFRNSLIAGGSAGTMVDVILFPIDTLKTRLQSHHGFTQSGGFRGIYSGLASAALGSAPTAAVFFSTYEVIKTAFHSTDKQSLAPVVHMIAASVGEVTACLLRVPVEVVKQRTQTKHSSTSFNAFRKTVATEGFLGLYRGYISTISREIPFAFIQFPLWEYFKVLWSRESGVPITAWQSGICGALAGGIAAGITTPLDVAKTRIMLAEKSSKIAQGSILYTLRQIRLQRGIKGLFAGVVPRVIWISIGGAIFLGVYEEVKIILNSQTWNV
ncbi:S-adenosylmethionine mitochondrial carrier protein-like [Gigantopelta aegis]|uniref:S-adenosylmethionine mitochondrial carrier protein-like n=1 Tax=Gigantopelta aegis TaxID=1735272 RepID=UPI001B88DCCF|nr:S-adenosylmethionine mitochondrial carrier protein-like [Gigantopelta aegis]